MDMIYIKDILKKNNRRILISSFISFIRIEYLHIIMKFEKR